ncbi:fibrinogen-like protein A [Saccostrea cucullata]|uniref:fibrinogen-like protein A n=1 Tax=Saccostrea cuccullata TaxID=36930 RepID=UPI002ED17ABE
MAAKKRIPKKQFAKVVKYGFPNNLRKHSLEILLNLFKLCRSVDWIQEEKTCRLNSRFVFKKDNSLITKGPTFHELEDFPVHLASNCLNNICSEDEICIGGKCVQVLKEFVLNLTREKKKTLDCSEILKREPSKRGQDGVYVIFPDTRREVFCDMTTDGGGWTVIQKREDGDVDFYRTWIEYRQGFGNSSKNYWIGNDAIHTLTMNKNQELRVDLQRHNGEQAYAVYTTFYIGDEDSKYRLTVSGYSGTAGDSLWYNNRMIFTTKDQDNDRSVLNCGVSYHGGWWYNQCAFANLNGQYAQSARFGWKYTIWYYWKGTTETLKQTLMMVRNKN